MKRSIVLFVYAALVLAAGFYAFSVAPDRSKAPTALMAPGMGAGITAILGILLAMTRKQVFAKVAIGFIALFAAAVLVRAITAVGDESKAYVLPVLFGIVVLSIGAIVGLVIPQTRDKAKT